MRDLLLGYRGFVGSNLALQFPEAMGAGRQDIPALQHESFNNVFCAAPQAKKWWANQNPELDKQEVQQLLESCRKLQFQGAFYLFGTIDVYDPPRDVDETVVPSLRSHPYGANRAWLEKQLLQEFGSRLRVIRLPALVGQGLKKNIIYDLLNNNNIEKINPNSAYQWFNLVHLPEIIQFFNGVADSVYFNVVSEPLPTTEIIDRWFPETRDILNWADAPIGYDVRSIHSQVGNQYFYTAADAMEKHLRPFIEASKGN